MKSKEIIPSNSRICRARANPSSLATAWRKISLSLIPPPPPHLIPSHCLLTSPNRKFWATFVLYLLWRPMTFTTRGRARTPHQLSLCKCKNPRKKWMPRLRSGGQVWPGILKAHHTYHRILPWEKKRSFQQKREWWEVHKNSLIPLHSEDQKSLCGGKIISLKLVIFFNCFVLIFSGLTPNL